MESKTITKNNKALKDNNTYTKKKKQKKGKKDKIINKMAKLYLFTNKTLDINGLNSPVKMFGVPK